MAQTISEMTPLPFRASRVLEPVEEEVLTLLWSALTEKDSGPAEESKSHLTMALVRLEKILEAINVHPSILRGHTLGARHRDLNSLIDTLSCCHPYSTEVFLPTRGTLAKAFLHAKLNYCRLLTLVAADIFDDAREFQGLRDDIERIQTSAVCNIMAEDLLRMIASDQSLSAEIRRRATWVLVHMWEDRICQVVPRFFPALDSAWQAKANITVSYGTLTGVTELLTLLGEGCDPVFVECFSLDDATDDEEFALQEFVFNFPYEQLQQIQQYMSDTGNTSVDAVGVSKILSIPVQKLHIQTCTCEEMIFTFRERQSMANHRRALHHVGPKRTAEEYLMTFLLAQAGNIDKLLACVE